MSTEVTIAMVPVDKVGVAPENVRVEGREEANPELERNIAKIGLLQDIVGYWKGERFLVVIGRDRFLSLKKLGRDTVPVKVRPELRGYEGRKASFSENIARSDMDPVSRAKSVQEMIEESSKSLSAVARDLGVSKGTLSEWRAILQLDPKLLEHVEAGRVSYRVAREIVRRGVSLDKQRLAAELLETPGYDVKTLLKAAGIETRGAPAGLLTIRFNFNPQEDIEQKYYDIVQSEATRLGVDPGGLIKGVVIEWAKPKLREQLKGS